MINDFNTSTNYEILIDGCLNAGVPIHFTENTLISGEIMPTHIVDLNDWQVDEWPSIPDGAWLKAPGGFLRPDDSRKPDEKGFATVEGFKGDYIFRGEAGCAAMVLSDDTVNSVVLE